MSQIETALSKIFDRHRIVFWYDVKRELRAEFDALALPGVEKIVLGNNQFGVKYRILREAPERKFLLYHEGPPPEDIDNWLLDVELAHGSFRAGIKPRSGFTSWGWGRIHRCHRPARGIFPGRSAPGGAQGGAASG